MESHYWNNSSFKCETYGHNHACAPIIHIRSIEKGIYTYII